MAGPSPVFLNTTLPRCPRDRALTLPVRLGPNSWPPKGPYELRACFESQPERLSSGPRPRRRSEDSESKPVVNGAKHWQRALFNLKFGCQWHSHWHLCTANGRSAEAMGTHGPLDPATPEGKPAPHMMGRGKLLGTRTRRASSADALERGQAFSTREQCHSNSARTLAEESGPASEGPRAFKRVSVSTEQLSFRVLNWVRTSSQL